MMDVRESRMCSKCRVSFNTDDEFWLHLLNTDCNDSKSATEVQNLLSDSTNSNDESQFACTSGSSSRVDGVFSGLCDENFQAKEDFQMKSTSPEHQCEIDLSPGAIERNTDSPALSTQSSLFCDVCQVPFTSIKNKEEHENGKMHKKQMALKSKSSGQLDISQSLSITSDIAESFSKIHIQWPPATQSSVSNNSTANKTVDTHRQPTLRSGDEEIIRLLRRLCLTRTLSLLQNVNESFLISSRSDSPETEMTSSTNERDLIAMVRTICREELREILPTDLQHPSHQSRNPNT
ncbi:unnamed protein product [Trichobilharzia szidati]|nr:unnamed protein product [Trichobilharzia szidati]